MSDAGSRDPARFVRVFLTSTLLGLAGVAALNYMTNPLSLYPRRLLPPMVWNSRSEKLGLFAALAAPPQAFVLGSSRSMQISPRRVRGRTGFVTFNAAVDSARAEDYFVLLRYFRDHGVRPRLLLVGADVESFHDHLPADERLLQIPELRRHLKRDDADEAGFLLNRVRKLVSLQQTQSSLQALANQLRGSWPARSSHFESDGYLQYDAWARERAGGRYDLATKIAKTRADYVARFAGYTRVSPRRLQYFAEFLRMARESDARVIVFLTPLHREVIATLAGTSYEPRRRELIAALRVACAAGGARFLDTSSVELFGGGPDGFWDGAHLDPANADRLADYALGTDG